MTGNSTVQKILKIATDEFLEKGFRGASLREIVKKAGVTTGAFYGYYKSKEELFNALVSPHGDHVLDIFKNIVSEFMEIPKTQWAKNMFEYSDRGMREIYEYAYENKDAFRLILSASEGTKWENFIHKIVEVEVEMTHIFYKEIEKEGYKPFAFDPTLEHMIISGEFSAFFELIIHDVPKEDGLRCVKELHDFYQAAWASVLKIEKN
ncbi:MAG: TetR/AcrR family transcriptional regulator [Treponema sp.]|nr:TetR/AcrR family transcriptional regulator [Treponema sp.]MBP3772912.1 TetR/AcrR family transcriptional regulator [Treponema sp.]